MPSIRNVLVPIDLSDPSRAALGAAAALARAFQAKLTAVHVAPPPVPYDEWAAFAPAAPLDEARRRTLEETLRHFVTPEGASAPLASVVVRQGDAATEILAAADAAAADLVVVATRGHHTLERWIVGSVTERVARQARCPVLAIPWAAAAPGFGRVVCAVDLSAGSTETVAHAAAFARAVGSPLLVLHVVDGPHGFEPWTLAGQTLDEARDAACADARRRLQAVVAPYVAEGLLVEVRVAVGEPHAIVEDSLGGDDLVVVGLRPSRGIDRFFYGSTATHVLRAGTCPVMLVGHQAAAPAGPTVAVAG